VTLQSEVRLRLAKAPDLHRAIQRGRGESIRVFRVEAQMHDIVAVALEELGASPALLPVPQLDSHVVGGGEHQRERRMDSEATDKVRVGLKLLHLLHGVVVVDTDAHVV
jgi:hypothetical protein